MLTPPKRKDYARNLRAKKHAGCTWCGADIRPPVTTSSYCSDDCVQADYEGIDDVPPVVPCGDPRSMSEGAKSRTIERMNASYSYWTARQDHEQETGSGDQ